MVYQHGIGTTSTINTVSPANSESSGRQAPNAADDQFRLALSISQNGIVWPITEERRSAEHGKIRYATSEAYT
jgi:hypothetical protein